MYIARKIMLLPTKKQEEYFWKATRISRFIYNWYIAINQPFLNFEENAKLIKSFDASKALTLFKKMKEFKFLNEVSSRVCRQAIADGYTNIHRYLNKLSKKPKFKSAKRSRSSFYVDYEVFHKTQNGCYIDKLGNVKTVEQLPKISCKHYSEPYVVYENNHWYITFAYKIEDKELNKKGKSIGIDLGIKDLAIVSDKRIFKNINKDKYMRRLQKRYKHLQRSVSRKFNANVEAKDKNGKPTKYKKPLRECKNYQKALVKRNKVLNRITNIRNNYIHQVTTKIARTKQIKRVVMEDIKIRNIVKNKHLSKTIYESKWYMFITCMKYKCERYGIEFIQAKSTYPSTQKCSKCGNVRKGKDKLTLKDRIYECKCCGFTIDRDLNASINLSKIEKENVK